MARSKPIINGEKKKRTIRSVKQLDFSIDLSSRETYEYCCIIRTGNPLKEFENLVKE